MNLRRTRSLVTGGAGFIGSHLVQRLLAADHSVRVVDNLSTGTMRNVEGISSQIEFIENDLRDPKVCDAASRDIDFIFHVAAQPSVPKSFASPLGSHENNVNVTVHLLESARRHGVRRFIYSSSSSVYGDEPRLPKVETAEPLPRSPYAAAKLAGEQYSLAYARSGLLEAVALRYFNVFGPRQDPNGPYAAVVPLLMRAALTGAPMTIFGDGLQTRDFTYVDNVIDANILAATLPMNRVNGWAVNIGAGRRTSLLHLVEMVQQTTGREVRTSLQPSREGDVRDSLASLDRAKSVLGYEPKISLEEGLSRLWSWIREENVAPPPAASQRTGERLA